MITVDELFNQLRFETTEFFSVEFERRTSRPDGSAVAGDVRKMLCRTGVQQYKKGVIPNDERDWEDFNAAVLTVWDFQTYLRNRQNGMLRWDAGYKAWRRIDLTTVSKCSVLKEEDFPPLLRQEFHHIKNLFRLNHLPRVA